MIILSHKAMKKPFGKRQKISAQMHGVKLKNKVQLHGKKLRSIVL
jgi:hypothetical protein